MNVRGYLLVERDASGSISLRATKRAPGSTNRVVLAQFRVDVTVPDMLIHPPTIPVEVEIPEPPYAGIDIELVSDEPATEPAA